MLTKHGSVVHFPLDHPNQYKDLNFFIPLSNKDLSPAVVPPKLFCINPLSGVAFEFEPLCKHP